MINPKSGFIANSNNDPWSSTYPFELYPKDYFSYISDTPYKNFDLRSVKSIKLLTSRKKLDFEDLIEMQASTHSELADKTVDELVKFGINSENTLLKESATVLKNWDRTTNSESKGAVLFTNWYFAARKVKMFENDFSDVNPLNTPNTLTEQAKAKLLEAAQQTIKNHGSIDVAWGEVYQTIYAGKTLKGGLGLGELGSFNAGFYGRGNDSKWNLMGGSAFTATIEFGKKIRARGILSYGNSSEKNSPFRGDQLQLMVDRKLREIFFYPVDIDKNLNLTERLKRF
jgi:acyl-homoserine-lactone acylase